MAKQAATPPKKPANPPPRIGGTSAPVSPPARQPAPPPREAPPRTKHSNAVAKDFGDDTIKGGFSDRPETFRGKAGMTYIARMMTMPIMFAGAYVENVSDKGKSFFMASRANIDTARAAMDGDESAWKEAALECPLFERDFKVKPRFCVGLYVISTIDAKGRETRVDHFYPWVFAGERYQNFTSISKSLPTLSNGTRMKITQCELQMTCTDDNFQKFNIAAISSPRDFRMKYAEAWEKCSQFFQGDTADSPCDLIEETIAPDDKRSMMASLDRAQGLGKGQAVQEVDDHPRGRTSQPQPARGGGTSVPARRPAAQPQAEEVGDDAETNRAIDEALGDLGGDGGGEPAADDGGGDGLTLDDL